jgi:hypothetical protein
MDHQHRKPSPADQANAHPETANPVERGVPGAESSKNHSKQPDARTGQDKDGNEQQARPQRKST